MGKGGETIRQICMTSGAHCQVDKNAPEGSREKNIVIKGKQENVLKAKVLTNQTLSLDSEPKNTQKCVQVPSWLCQSW